MKVRRPIIIEGESVALGVIVEEDLEKFWFWVNDKEVMQYLSDNLFYKIYTLTMEKQWLDSVLRGQKDTLAFAILLPPEYKLIGITSLGNIDWRNRNAELAIFIGEKDLWGRGLGTEALVLLLDYAFNVLGLNKVYLRAIEYNERAIKCYLKVGFKIVGRLRKQRFRGGRYWDEIAMDILAEEFRNKHKSRIKKKLRDLYMREG